LLGLGDILGEIDLSPGQVPDQFVAEDAGLEEHAKCLFILLVITAAGNPLFE
jgi:hypothetical protein